MSECACGAIVPLVVADTVGEYASVDVICTLCGKRHTETDVSEMPDFERTRIRILEAAYLRSLQALNPIMRRQGDVVFTYVPGSGRFEVGMKGCLNATFPVTSISDLITAVLAMAPEVEK